MNKRWIIRPIIAVLVILTVCSFLAWVTNLIFALPRWGLFELGTLGNLINEIEQVDLFKWLSSVYIVTVDLSTVTTAVIMFTLLYATLGMEKVYLVIRGKRKIAELCTEHFPFESTYQTFYVYMGLLGTLWGFIVAFRETTPEDPEILLLALGTALWSTFSAIILAFLVCPCFFEKLFRYIVNNVSKSVRPDPDQEDAASDITATAHAFNNLSCQLNVAKEALQRFTGEIDYWESLQKTLSKLSSVENELQELTEKIPQIEMTCEEIKKTIPTMEDRLGKLEGDLKEVKKAKKTIFKIRDLLRKLS